MGQLDKIRRKYISSALITAGVYGIFGALWIYFSDTILGSLVTDMNTFEKLAKYKGWFYVLITSVLLYFLSNFLNRALRKSEAELYISLRTAEEINLELEISNTDLEEKVLQLSENEAKLLENEEKFILAVQGVQDCIWDWNLDTNEIWYPKTKELLGYKIDDLGDSYEHFEQIVHPDDLQLLENVHEDFKKGIYDNYELEYRLLNVKGRYQWVFSKAQGVRNEKGETIRLVGTHFDINDRKKQEEKMHDLAYGDVLTGLPNKSGLEIILKEIIQTNPDKVLGLIYFDLDKFKMINDSFGHDFGDMLLKEIGIRLTSNFEWNGTIARTGGDEFAILLSDVAGKKDLTFQVGFISDFFVAPFKVANREIYVTPSIGVTMYPKDGTDLQTLMKCADMAMYSAKEMGKNNFQFYDDEMHNKVLRKAEMEFSLRRAIDTNEFVLHFQPIIDLKKGRIHAFEALVRWVRIDGEIISPMEFIPLAEETGLIIPLGELVIEKACYALELLQDRGYERLGIGVNFSIEQFSRADLVDKVLDNIDKKNLKRSNFVIEVTESIAMDDSKKRIQMLHRFSEEGISVTLDDFGTGYSSMSYLKILPLACVKIDKAFTRDVVDNEKDKSILEAIRVMSKGFGFYTLAEGVETMEQLQVILETKCRFAQGYLFSKPVPFEQIYSILEKENEYMALVLKAKERITE